MPSRLPETLESGLTRRHIPSLDGLRAIAALLVVLDHFGVNWAPGGLGVLAFFVLSGFLITWLLLKEERRNERVSLGTFYIRRSLRIFPAFYFYWLLVTGYLLLRHKPIEIAQTVCSFFYVNNYYQAIFGDPSTALSHTWSLGVEEQFYLLWPLIFLFLKTARARVGFLCAAIGGLWIYREILVFVAHRNQGYIYEAFDTRADHLLIGCLLAVALFEGMFTRLWRLVCSPAWAIWPTLTLLAISSAIAARSSAVYRDAVGFVVDPILVAILIVQTAANDRSGFGTMLNLKWVRYLGTISYSIYLYQQLVIVPVTHATAGVPLISLPATMAAVILAASASYHFIEKPFLRIKDRFAAPVSAPHGRKDNDHTAFDAQHRR